MTEEILESKTILSVVSKLSLFCALDENEFNTVSNFLKTLHITKGETLFNEGDTGEDMFVLFSGTLNAYGTQSDGTQRMLFNVAVGEFFGEMSVIAHTPRSVTITATEDSIAVKFKGNDFYRIINEYPVIGSKILRSISIVQNNWLDQSSKSVSDLVRWGETARRRAVTDEMTGLYNRRFLEDSINKRFNNQSMNLRITSLLMMDLDKIHGINDKHGTKAGDIVITAASEIIRSCLRQGDIPARLSGDEFAILLPDTDKKDAVRIAEQIRKNIEKLQIEVPESPNSAQTVMIGTRTSIGIAIAPAHARTLEELEETSDFALRKAKELGRNRVEVFSKNN
ncbi:MAG: GGDEF domain-containing protein [Treponema sp.]|nr:GGDEF domain-containing protein [Treponema sp.]MCL2250800.1 GGDEF domain-containing protein [Treponema sp.]